MPTNDTSRIPRDSGNASKYITKMTISHGFGLDLHKSLMTLSAWLTKAPGVVATCVLFLVALFWGWVWFWDVGVVTESTAVLATLTLPSVILSLYAFQLYSRSFEMLAVDPPVAFNADPESRPSHIAAMFEGASDSVVVLADHLWPGVYEDDRVIRAIRDKRLVVDEGDREIEKDSGERTLHRRIPVWVLVRCDSGEVYEECVKCEGCVCGADERDKKDIAYNGHAFLKAIHESKVFELMGIWYVGDITCHNLILVDGYDSRIEYNSPALPERLCGPEKDRPAITRRNNPRAYKRGARVMIGALSTSSTPVKSIGDNSPKSGVKVSREVKPFVDHLAFLLTSDSKEQAA